MSMRFIVKSWLLLAATIFALSQAPPALAAADLDDGTELDLREYYPLGDGNNWTYQFRAHQPDGQIAYSLKTYRVDGTVELPDGAKPKKLIDQRGWYYLLDVESDRYLHYGEHEANGLIWNEPPFAFYDTQFAFGKSYSFAHLVHSKDSGSVEAKGTSVVFDGFESLRVPAGEFKNCLKSTFTYINPNGSTFTSVTYLAKGVGPVKKDFAIYSPKAGQTLRFDRELLAATINGQKVGGQGAITVTDLGSYFPFFQGDSWTYDWAYTLHDGTRRSEERTRRFEGTQFFDNTAAYKLLDDKGSFQYYTYFPEEGIRMHGSFENRPGGNEFTYQPPLLIARADMVVGVDYKWSEPEMNQPEDAGRYKRLQHWTSRVEGFQPFATPMGTFPQVLRTRLSWDTSGSWSSQTYYWAEHVGLVGTDYEAIDKKTGKRVIALEGRLKQAHLQGDQISSLTDIGPHVKNVEAAAAALQDDPKAREIFKAASLNRYVWDGEFPGIAADIEIVDHGAAPVMAKVKVDRSFKIDFECDACSSELRSMARAQISQFVTHRFPEPFEDKYGVGKAYFHLVKEREDGTYEIEVAGDRAMGSWYLIDGKEVRKLTRTLGGSIRFMINHERNIITEDGRYIANYYPVDYFIEKDGQRIEIASQTFDDVFEKQGDYWLPKHRTLKGTMPMPDRSIADVDLELRFVNVTYQ
jgi:hypothetical protein